MKDTRDQPNRQTIVPQPPAVARRTLAGGAAWAVPTVMMAAAAPTMAASATNCLSLFRESSGGPNSCTMGLWTNSNTSGGTTYPTTLQTKPLYDCLCGPLTYCTASDPATIYNVKVQFLIPPCYAISPSSMWTRDSNGTPWTTTLNTTTYNGGTYQLLTVSYATIVKYGSGQQIQVPLSSKGCPAGSDAAGPKIYSRMQGLCTSGGTNYSTPWTVIPTSGTSWTS